MSCSIKKEILLFDTRKQNLKEIAKNLIFQFIVKCEIFFKDGTCFYIYFVDIFYFFINFLIFLSFVFKKFCSYKTLNKTINVIINE